jgi:drug/metabolite transporter (DMT)-like permease
MPALWQPLCASTILVPLSLIVDQPWTLQPSTVSLLAVLALAIFDSALGYIIYFHLITTLGSVGTTAQAYIRVPIGVAAGVLLLGESLSPTIWIGLVCVVAGVAAMTMRTRRAEAVAVG